MCCKLRNTESRGRSTAPRTTFLILRCLTLRPSSRSLMIYQQQGRGPTPTPPCTTPTPPPPAPPPPGFISTRVIRIQALYVSHFTLHSSRYFAPVFPTLRRMVSS